jgi:hypothetical protein
MKGQLSSSFARRYGGTGVMIRGDRREAILLENREGDLLAKILGQACERRIGRFERWPGLQAQPQCGSSNLSTSNLQATSQQGAGRVKKAILGRS